MACTACPVVNVSSYSVMKILVVKVGTPMEQHALKNVNNCLNTNIYSYLGASGSQSSILYLIVVHFFQHQC